MDIIVSAKSFALTPSLHEYAVEKFGKLEKFWSKIVRLRVELDLSHHHHHGQVNTATITVELPGSDIHLTETSSEMHAAIDVAVEKLERLIIRAKAKKTRSSH